MSTKLDKLSENSILLDEENETKIVKKTSSRRGRKPSKKTTSKTRKRTAKKIDVSIVQETTDPIEVAVKEIPITESNQLSETTIEVPKKKRTIKSIKKTKKEEPVSNAQETIKVEKIVAKPETPKKKRTLRLNLNFAKPQNEQKPRVVDNSIIESSSFFYEPSVFEKFNLTISNIDDNDEPIYINSESSQEESLSDSEVLESEIPSQESATSDILNNFNSEELEELIDPVTENDNSNNNSEEIATQEESKEENVAENVTFNTQEFHVDSIKEYIENKISEILPEFVGNNVQEAPAAADSIKNIGDVQNNFFESSTPSISVQSAPTRKIKRTISPIFKTFSYGQATQSTPTPENAVENIYQEIIPANLDNVSTIQKPLDNAIPEVEVKLDPIATVTTPVADTAVLVNTESDEKTVDMPIVSTNDTSISINDEIIQELLENEIINGDNTENPDSQDVENEELDNQEISENDVSEKNDEPVNPENSNSLDILPDVDDSEETDEEPEEFSFDEDIDYDNINLDEEEKEEKYDDDAFSIESYFGLDNVSDEDIKEFKKESEVQEPEIVNLDEELEKAEEAEKAETSSKKDNGEFSTITKLLENFNESINNLSDKISDLENQKSVKTDNTTSPTSSNTDIELSDEDLLELLADDDSIIDSSKEDSSESEAQIVEDILSEALSSDESNEELKNSLISEVLSTEEEIANENVNSENDDKIDSDFSKVLECLTKAIKELEEDNKPEAVSEVIPEVISTPANEITSAEIVKNDIPAELANSEPLDENKSINILIDKEDIFSIQILNETYEIMADFNAISVLSENINISTPKNNFYVKIGEKYIEIHNNKDHFEVLTNFEDVEFANAINNVGFAKKNNRIELNIKEAFKLASINNRIELSMLNKTIASIKDVPVTEIDENSICDNRTLLISEETQKVYLPYTISDVMNKLKYNDEYETIQDVVDNEYTVPLSTFKMPIISRFREAYRFMRTKENSSVYAAIDLAVELMFNSNLNPAVIRAAKDLKELNIYLDCLYENEVEKFDCFKIVYKVLPKVK